MPQILLGVTGSVAAIKTDDLVPTLLDRGHQVRVILTRSGEFFLPRWSGATPSGRIPTFRDRDEWPSSGWSRGDDVLHIELVRWADVFLIAPLDAHTLGKWAQGLADNLLTSTLRAWNYAKPIVVAPAMNTRMWENPITRRHFAQILADRDEVWPGAGPLPGMDELVGQFDVFREPIRIVPPIPKTLACGDYGVGAMAGVDAVADRVELVWRQVQSRAR
jgi:phosphopantothenoylcysteine decarboxylase